MVRDSLDGALLDLATLYRDVMMVQSFSAATALSLLNKELEEKILVMAEKSQPERILEKLNAIMQARTSLSYNAAPLLTIEALMCALAQ
jgi:DNA polymerase-3 subunit delta'